MPRFLAKRAIGLFICALSGILIAGVAVSVTADDIPDAISPSCNPIGEFRGDAAAWQRRRFPESISVEIVASKQKSWLENLLRALTSRERNISPARRKDYEATVSWEIDGHRCESPAEVRLNGDAKDHISYVNSTIIASVAVKLLEGHVGNIVRFKLLLPETRLGDSEILTVLLFREFGFIAPETRMVTGYLNGVEVPYLFQESPAKEFMEANNLRESLLVEGDERWGWMMHSMPDVYSETLRHDAVWVENRSFGRADNKGWIENPVATAIATKGLTLANRLYHQYHIDKPHRQGISDHLGMTSAYRLQQNSEVIENESLFVLISKVLYASHGLRLHNRKFYYDPVYNRLKPIYYDGMALRDQDNRTGQFPRNGTFPDDQIQFVIDKLSDPEVRERIYSDLMERGGRTTRENYEELLDTALARALDLEPRPSGEVSEPPPINELDLPLLLSEEEEHRYEFYGLNAETGAFQHCVVSEVVRDGRLTTCEDTNEEPKEILGEPVAENGDPIPFVGAFERREPNAITFSRIETERQIVETNPRSLDLQIGSEELYVIEFTDEYDFAEPPTIKASIAATDTESGKLIVRGSVPAGASFELTASGTGGKIGLTRYDERLLTGCLTFIDASFSRLRVTSHQVTCEDAVNFVRSKGDIAELIVAGSFADAIDADFSKLEFDKIQIDRSANDCIDLSAGVYHVVELSARGCGDKAVSVGEKAVVSIEHLDVSGGIFGLAAKDSSYASIGDASFDAAVDYCIAAYRKKQEFDGARIAAPQSLRSACSEDRVFEQPGSVIEFY